MEACCAPANTAGQVAGVGGGGQQWLKDGQRRVSEETIGVVLGDVRLNRMLAMISENINERPLTQNLKTGRRQRPPTSFSQMKTSARKHAGDHFAASSRPIHR